MHKWKVNLHARLQNTNSIKSCTCFFFYLRASCFNTYPLLLSVVFGLQCIEEMHVGKGGVCWRKSYSVKSTFDITQHFPFTSVASYHWRVPFCHFSSVICLIYNCLFVLSLFFRRSVYTSASISFPTWFFCFLFCIAVCLPVYIISDGLYVFMPVSMFSRMSSCLSLCLSVCPFVSGVVLPFQRSV